MKLEYHCVNTVRWCQACWNLVHSRCFIWNKKAEARCEVSNIKMGCHEQGSYLNIFLFSSRSLLVSLLDRKKVIPPLKSQKSKSSMWVGWLLQDSSQRLVDSNKCVMWRLIVPSWDLEMVFLKLTGLRKEVLDMSFFVFSREIVPAVNGWVLILKSWNGVWYWVVCNLAFILLHFFFSFLPMPYSPIK